MLVMASTYRDHVILCGLGHLGFRVLLHLREGGALVVALSGVTEPPDTCEELKNFGEIDIAATIRIFRRRAKASPAVRRGGSRASAEELS